MGKLKLRIVRALIVLCQFLKLSGGAISFTKRPGDPSYVKKGNNATLVWDYSVTNNQTELKAIIWAVYLNNKFANLVVEHKNGDRVISRGIPSAYKGRIGIEGRATLVIENITSQDSTTFRCTIKAAQTADLVNAIKLIVTDAPQIIISQIQSSYKEGSVVSIMCTASGTPHPDIQWIRNERVITSGTKEASLMFSSINRTDDGPYSCKATNLAGNDKKQVTLVVYYKPEGTTLNTSAADNTVIQEGSVTFTCHVTAAKPQVSQYKFYLNDTDVAVKDSNDSQYTIDNVQRSQHYGKYKCVPRNDVGDGPEATVILNVNVPVQVTALPQNLTVNETNPILVSCDASGFPEPSFKWQKDGQILSQPKLLSIQTSDRSDTGLYVCTASNGVGQDKTAQAYVTVQYPPTIKEATPSTDKSWIGQTVTLTCVSDGVPTPTLTWFKPDGSQISSVTDTHNTVNVKMSVDQDFDGYKCDADNGLAPTIFKIVKIEQIKKPGPPAIVQLDIQATSLTVNWTAPADDGGSSITAYRVVILKGSTEIKNVNITDPGITSLSVGDLERDTKYTVKVFARNYVFEGPTAEKEVTTKYEGVPAAATIDDLPNEVTDDTITLKWREPESNGKVITQYSVYQRIVTDGKPGEWIKLETTADSVRELTVELESGKVYEFVVTATNKFGESLKEEGKVKRVKASDKSEGDDGTQTGGGDEGNGMGAAIYAGAAAAGVLLIIGIIVIIVLWRRRKPSSDEDTSRDELGSANPYELDDGYNSVSREAALSLQASGPVVEPNYAQVDQSRRKKNRMPANDEYAQVDKSKKTKKKKKKPGELDYADLEDLRADIQLGPIASGGAAAAAPIVRPPAYEGTVYADISQFGVPQPDPTYANVPKQEVVYSNVESM